MADAAGETMLPYKSRLDNEVTLFINKGFNVKNVEQKNLSFNAWEDWVNPGRVR